MQVRFCGSPDYIIMFIVVLVDQGSFVLSLFILSVELSLPDVSVLCPPCRKSWKCLSHILLVEYCTESNIDPKLVATQRLFPCNFCHWCDVVLETGLGSRDCLETHFWKSRLGLASDLNFKSRSRVLVSKSHGLEIWEVSRLKILVRRRSKILNLII